MLALSFSANAASNSLNWTTAVQEASRNNAELRAAEENLQAAQSTVQVARAGYLPSIDAAFTASLNGNDSSKATLGDQSFNSLNAKPYDSYSASITAKQSLFDGFATSSRVSQSRAQLREYEQQVAALKARVSYDLKSAYSGMMQAQRSLKLYLDIIKRRQENLRLVELRFASGQENKGAVLLSEAYLKQARYEEMQARDSLSVTRARLNKVLGRADDNSYELRDDIPTREAPGTADFVSLARNTPEFRLYQAQEEEASASLALSRAGYYPTVGLTGRVGRQDQDFFPNNESWSISMTLTVPLFSGGRDYYSRAAAQNKLTASGLNRENGERDLVAKLKQAQTGFVEAIEKLKVDESFQNAVTLRAEIARSKYNNGLTTFDDWDLIENDLINRQRAVLSSQGSRVVAEAAWEQAQGRGALQ